MYAHPNAPIAIPADPDGWTDAHLVLPAPLEDVLVTYRDQDTDEDQVEMAYCRANGAWLVSGLANIHLVTVSHWRHLPPPATGRAANPCSPPTSVSPDDLRTQAANVRNRAAMQCDPWESERSRCVADLLDAAANVLERRDRRAPSFRGAVLDHARAVPAWMRDEIGPLS